VDEIVVYLARAEERRSVATHRRVDIRNADVDRTRIPDPAGIVSPSHPEWSDSQSALPPYQVDPVPLAEPAPLYGWETLASDDVAPIYQPPYEPSAPTYEPQTKSATPSSTPLTHAVPAISDTPGDAPTPIYQPQPDLVAPTHSLPSSPVTSTYHASSQPLTPPQEAAPEPVVSIYRSPSDQKLHLAHADHDVIELPAEGHASLVLEPPSHDSAAEQPFVVHSVDERMPLSESLERAAALLEASSLDDPGPVVEQERVPFYNIAFVELPPPDGLAAPVERSPSPAQEATPVSMPSQPSGSSLLLDASAHTFDTAPIRQAGDPIANEIDAKPLARTDATEVALDATSTAVQPEATATTPESLAAARSVPPPTPATPAEHEPTRSSSSPGARRTASFEAALAAIRKAWGKPRRSLSDDGSPLRLNIAHTLPDPVSAPAPVMTEPVSSKTATQPPIDETGVATPVVSIEKSVAMPDVVPIEETVVASPMAQEATDRESKAQREVDLTLDIDALEDYETVTLVEPTPPEQVQIVAKPIEEDVYELSVSSGLRDVDTEPVATEPPPPEREVAPLTTSESPVEETAPAPRRIRATQRKKSDQRRPIKAQKAAPKPARMIAEPVPDESPKPARQNTEPVQDEWGLFDPNRCGFAALVDTLNKVTDEKEDKPSKTSVRVISIG
jgi:hypothetical protein